MATQYTTYYESPIGWIEIQGTITVILGVRFAEQNKVQSGETRLPNIITNCVQQLEEYFQGSRTTFTVNAEQKGTAFQQVVWKQLREIPYGKTTSYIEIAKRIADERIVRAVGSANGKNHLSILVPCHRVIGADGTLVGYAGELWRKDWLLKHEARYALGVQSLFGY